MEGWNRGADLQTRLPDGNLGLHAHVKNYYSYTLYKSTAIVFYTTIRMPHAFTGNIISRCGVVVIV